MFEIQKENYKEVKESCIDLLNILQNITSVKINEKEFKIEYFLSADYAMLRILMGHKNSNAAEGCLWCTANLRQPPNNELDQIPISRTLNDELNDHQEPILKFIEYKNIVVDLLHLNLRVSEKFFELLKFKLTRIDGNDGDIIENRPLLHKFMIFLRDECNITNPFYSSKKNIDKIKFRSFNGNEYLKIYSTIFKEYLEYDETTKKNILKRKNFSDIFTENYEPQYDNFLNESNLWFEFYQIYTEIKNYNIIDLDKLNTDLKNLLETFLTVNEINNNSNTIFPYLHIFRFHLIEMIQKYGNINKFSTQSLEKLNDFSTQYYHLGTNKKNFLSQLISKRNRIEFSNLSGNIDEFLHLDAAYNDEVDSDDEE